jgi:four helix bundle protein
MPFDHEKLQVYQVALVFLAGAHELAVALPRGCGHLADQVRRAALSVVLNIAEGAGKYSGDDKASFYTRARGSATECAAVLDVCVRLALVSSEYASQQKELLERVAQMLTRLIRTHQKS